MLFLVATLIERGPEGAQESNKTVVWFNLPAFYFDFDIFKNHQSIKTVTILLLGIN